MSRPRSAPSGPGAVASRRMVQPAAAPLRSLSSSRHLSPSSPLERQADHATAGAAHPGGLASATAADPGTARLPAHDDLPLGTGRRLDPAMAAGMGTLMGHDFSKVRIHDDRSAADAAERLGARAFARGDAIVFGRGEFRPQDEQGQRLLAHELAHVLQQRRPGAEAGLVQREEKKGSTEVPKGPGASAPEESFETADGKGDEDMHVLFGHDGIDAPASIEAMVTLALTGRSGPVTVDIHGYASLEGSDEYNRNLSAQRAAAVRRRILPLLPPGSVVRLFAHGQTGAFGDLTANRRAGIDIRDGVAAAPVAPTGAAGAAELPETLAPKTLPKDKQPPQARAPAGIGVALDDDRPALPPASATPWFMPPSMPLRLPTPMGLPLSGDIPGRLALLPPTFGPTPSPYLFQPSPPPLHAGLIDWSSVARDFSTRGLVLDQTMAADLQQHWLFWANLLHGLGLPADRAAFGANFGMEITAAFHLEQVAPTLGERFNHQLKNEGHSVIGPFNVVDLLKVYRSVREKMK